MIDKDHVRFEVVGAGDGFTVRLVRHRQTKETETDRLHLRDTAPVLDPTKFSTLEFDCILHQLNLKGPRGEPLPSVSFAILGLVVFLASVPLKLFRSR